MESAKITFTCTDRLGENKKHEKAVLSGAATKKAEGESDKKHFTRLLIDNLKEFQTEVNTIMTELVEKEKRAVQDNLLSNAHLNTKKKPTEDESDSESSSESEADAQKEADDSSLKRAEHDTEDPVEKRLCV